MLICFHATTEAKNALDSILETRHFRDISEAISMALVNYSALTRAVAQGGQIFTPALPADPTAAAGFATEPRPARPATSWEQPAIPEVFALKPVALDSLKLLNAPQALATDANNVPPACWLFGQYNKFLAPKATCRALLNLALESPAGLSVAEASNKISYAACILGDYLLRLDQRLQSKREDAFAAAFPSSATADGGGESRVRFGNQFVAHTRQEQLGGFPAALRLLALDGKELRLSLTKAGAEFAMLENPVLDCVDAAPTRKFSRSEVDFLLSHVLKMVPEEVSAYLAIFSAIATNANTPEKIDMYLCDRFNLRVVERAKKPTEITATFLTTQRTGAISRMVDLGLITREKAGLRVTYHITASGTEFSKTIKLQ